MKRYYLKYYVAGAAALLAAAVYLPALLNGFVNWDDTDLVLNNTNIRSLDLTFFRWAFAFSNSLSANWHPLTWISHAIDYAAWGLNPLGHHLTSLILHAINTFLVVLLVVRLIEASVDSSPFTPHPSPLAPHPSRFTLIAAATTGLLFGLHPLHVEPVAWVSARADLLCALFYLLSVMSYISYAKIVSQLPVPSSYSPFTLHSSRFFLSALCFFTLALMSKPMAVTLPAVLLILDWYPFQRVRNLEKAWNVFIEKLPFLVLSIMSAIVAVLARQSTGSILDDTPLSLRILVSFRSLAAYLLKMVLPFNLSSFYPYPAEASLFSIEYGSAVALVVLISAACLFFAKKEKIWASLWGYYIATLLPVIGIIRLGIPAMSDRYTYLPSLGLFLLTGLCAALMSDKANTRGRSVIVKLAGMVIIVFLSFLTVKQVGIWKDGLTLWSNVIEKTPEAADGYFSYLNRGELYFRAGRLDEALEDFDRAISAVPSFYTLYNRLGVAYGQDNSLDKAIECFNRALAVNPNDDSAYYYRGYTYSFLNQYNKAFEDYAKALELNQSNVKAYVQRGNLYLKTGNKRLAAPDFRKACDLGNEEGCNALKRLGA